LAALKGMPLSQNIPKHGFSLKKSAKSVHEFRQLVLVTRIADLVQVKPDTNPTTENRTDPDPAK
jgi:hypothetical protein